MRIKENKKQQNREMEKIHNKELSSLYLSSSTVKAITSK